MPPESKPVEVPTGGTDSVWTRRVLPVALLALFAAQCAWFIGTQSMTPDESLHIGAGQSAWRDGQFKRNDDNPALARLWFAFPVRGPEFQFVKREGQPVEAILPSPEALLSRARMMNVLLGLALGAALWCAARRFFSVGVANFALALYALSPALITHFSLATHDGPLTLMLFAAAYQFARWRRNPTPLATAVLGAALGAMMAVKLSAVPTFALAFVLVLVLGPNGLRWRPLRWNWKAAAIALACAGLVVWASYFFHVSRVTVRDGQLTAEFPNFEEKLQRRVPVPVNFTFYLPAGEFFTGIVNVAQTARRGVEGFMLGESYMGGKLSYFPVVIALKWPTIILLLALAGGIVVLARGRPQPAGFAVVFLFPAAFLALALASKVNLGDRYILPVYPFLLLLAAATWEYAKPRRAVAVALLLAVALQAGDTTRYAPDYLTYFNPLVDPTSSYTLLTDSCLDWGQGLLVLRRYEAEHPNETMYLAYFGNVNPQTAYGIRAKPLHDGEYPSGTIVVGARHLSGYTHKDRWNYHWVERYPRKAILGHVLHVFQVPEQAGPEATKSGGQEVEKSGSEDEKK